jgi:predicted CXXCH cytochrome family protein
MDTLQSHPKIKPITTSALRAKLAAVPLPKRIFLGTLALVLASLVMASIGFGFAAHQEQNDSFCASCHTNPESIYYARSIAPKTVDLATAHALEETRCIDCHSGEGIFGRISAEVMGARNAVMWVTGRATQPAPLTNPITDEHCVKCHGGVTGEEHDADVRSKLFGPLGHYHANFIRWQEMDQNAGSCVSCHSGHDLGGVTKNKWIVTASVKDVCQACHDVMNTDEASS